MGLKTTNYVSKKTGVPMATAYAKIKDLVLNGNKGRAIFAIQASREAMDVYEPVDKVEVHFEWDRKSDIAKTAYEAAKTETKTVEKYNPETGEPYTETEYGTLYGWDNDIVE